MRFWLAQRSNLSNWTDIINFFLSLWPWFISIFSTSSFFFHLSLIYFVVWHLFGYYGLP